MCILNKVVYILIFVFLFCSALFAQEPELNKGEFAALVRAGIVTSQIHNDNFGGYNKLGGTIGTGVFTPLSKDLKLQFEINYAMRGSRKRPNPKSFDYSTFTIELPILLRKFIWKFEFEGGLNNSFFLFSRIKDPNFLLPLTIKDFNRYELAANLGINVPIKDQWNANVRLHYSITPAIGSLQFVSGLALLGGAYNNAVTFSIVRTFIPK